MRQTSFVVVLVLYGHLTLLGHFWRGELAYSHCFFGKPHRQFTSILLQKLEHPNLFKNKQDNRFAILLEVAPEFVSEMS